MIKVKNFLSFVLQELKEFIGYEYESAQERERKERIGNATKNIITGEAETKW